MLPALLGYFIHIVPTKNNAHVPSVHECINTLLEEYDIKSVDV